MISKNNLVIGITDCHRYENYEKWIQAEPGVRVIKLAKEHNFANDIKQCDGIMLTGGQDVHPRLYGKPEYQEYYQLSEIDENRDEFELKVLEYAMKAELPLLGICRGLQICNVFLGGTLVPDLPSFGKQDHSRFMVGKDRYHNISVQDQTMLKEIVGSMNGEINSAHHQSADKIAPGLKANAISEDGVIEGLERNDPGGKPFLLLVQWHPERMDNLQSAFSKNIRERFVTSIVNRESSIVNRQS